MQEFEDIVYLDLQKTGSTTIKGVLADILDERRTQQKRHGALPKGFDRSKLFFISVREPLSLYISLFNFGAGNRKGALFKSLSRKGREDLFNPSHDAFEAWLRFMLDPENASLIRQDYGRSSVRDSFGVHSFRVLYLSVPKSRKRMLSGKFESRDEIRELFQRRVYEDYVRTENLGGDLFAFLSKHADRLKFRHPLTSADDLIASVPVRNESKKVPGLTPQSVSPELRELVREREWLIYEAFGYDTHPKGRPPNCLLPATAIEHGVSERPSRQERKAKRRERRKAKRQADASA